MNEYQNDYNSDFNLDDSISQHYQVSETSADYDQNPISIEPPQPNYDTQPSWESNSQLDNGFGDDSSLNQSSFSDNLTSNSFEPDSISYAPDITSFPEQNSQVLEQHFVQDLNHQEMYDITKFDDVYGSVSNLELLDGGGTTFDNLPSSQETLSSSNTFKNQLVEQSFEHQTNLFNSDLSHSQQRTGREPTADELDRANKLVHQAESAHQDYENAMATGKFYDQQSSYDKAAEYKQKEEELRARADRLRNPS